MATVPNGASPQIRNPLHHPFKKDDLRRERMSALAILAILIALLAIIVWLAVAGSGPPPTVEEYMPFMM